MYMYIYVYKYIYICLHVYRYIQIYIHTYIYIFMYPHTVYSIYTSQWFQHHWKIKVSKAIIIAAGMKLKNMSSNQPETHPTA